MANTKKITNFEFHLQNIKKLDDEWRFLKKIPTFPFGDPRYYYSRDDNSGWWMAIKQTAFRGYISAYLSILGKEKDRKLYFIDPLSSYGMVRVTKNYGKDKFTFPGTSINAALISNQKKKGFDGFYINDLDLFTRNILSERILSIKTHYNNKAEINIDISNNKIDSNNWLINIMRCINEENSFYHCLIIIDNQAMNIYYDTIQKIREISEYCDVIITFQDANIARAIPSGSPKIERFFGCEIPPNTKNLRNVLCDKYCDQLSKVNLPKIERMKVASETGYFYTLLFCCRQKASGEWFKIIRYYNDERFKNFTDREQKRMWDIRKGKQLSLTHDWN
ncbi:MAG: hypothetical protein CEE43_14460 [Promethearchaeota archaeon Loki_b32]|nr:MAG: hypothetical protein CEE43_14460 [Candidatus Lokiarchaeota archaeon Loki_b32]